MVKYRMTEETRSYEGRILHRIKALTDFADVRCGDLGGWIQTGNNLSHDGNCWIYDDAICMDNAGVRENAILQGNSEAYVSAIIKGNASVDTGARIFDSALISGSTMVNGGKIFGNASVNGNAIVVGDNKISGYADIRDNSFVKESIIHGNAFIKGDTKVINSDIRGTTVLIGDSIFDGADIACDSDYIAIRGLGKYCKNITFYKSKYDNVWANSGAFYGTLDEFKMYAKTLDNKLIRKEFIDIYKLAKRHFM